MILREYKTIEENIRSIKNPFLVLKDNAYGFGIEEMVNIAMRNNINLYAVNNIKEAKRIININKDSYILLIAPTREVDNRFIYTVSDKSDYLFCLSNGLAYHYEVNISMNRFGFDYLNEEIISNVLCEGIYFHSNGNDLYKDINKFNTLIKRIKRKGLIYHAGGSKLINYNLYHNRVGIALYKDAYKIIGHVIKVRNVKKGEYVGYGKKYKAKKNIIVAILDIGYKNGLKEDFTYKFQIKETIYNSIGYLCMDYTFLLVDELVRVNDKAILVNKDDRSEYEFIMSIK